MEPILQEAIAAYALECKKRNRTRTSMKTVYRMTRLGFATIEVKQDVEKSSPQTMNPSLNCKTTPPDSDSTAIGMYGSQHPEKFKTPLLVIFYCTASHRTA